jgi:hypothetical protein
MHKTRIGSAFYSLKVQLRPGGWPSADEKRWQWNRILTDDPGACTGATGPRPDTATVFWLDPQLFVPLARKDAKLASGAQIKAPNFRIREMKA